MTHYIDYLNWNFTSDKIGEGNLYLVTSLLSSALEVNTLSAVVECSDPSILNFERNAPLRYYTRPDQPMIFRVQNIERAGPETYHISATSTLGLLTEGKHYGGIYTGQTAQEIIASICGSVPFIIKNNLAGTKLYGWLPIAAPRDNLSQVLFAIGAALKTDLDGVLRIAGLWDGVSGTVGKDELYQEAKVEHSAKVTQVVLTEHQYSEGGETKKLFEGTAQAGDIITFSGPMYALSASGFSIQESGANWAKVSGGSGALTGKEYVHNTRLITRNVQTANTPNIKTVDKATLVSLVNSSAVADRLAAFYKCTQTIDAPVVYKGENPGNIMSTYHPFDKSAVQACIQSADITLSGTLKAQEKSLVGFAPAQETGIEYEDRHETITSSGTWTVPDGVTEVTVVCIGGGTGGYSGYKGSSTPVSTQPTLTQTSSISPGSCYTGFYPGEGCLGGDGGQPGGGGKVFTQTISVTEGQSIQATIGVGGSGGSSSSSGSNAGSQGGVTVFGSVSSDSGSPSENGYTDIVSGIKYATPGTLVGIKGGKGGSRQRVASASDSIVIGESVTDRNGVTWSAGSVPSPSDRKTSSNGNFYAGSGKGMGGGAAAGGNGQAGSYGSATAYSNRAYATGGTGGRGGNAAAPAKTSVRGGGGNGGNGGGGGGGPGLCGCERSGSTSSSGLNPSRGSAGPGGSGSNGGQGGDGIIILYYRIPKVVPAGQLVDKNNKMVLDRLGRRIIV